MAIAIALVTTLLTGICTARYSRWHEFGVGWLEVEVFLLYLVCNL